MRIPSVLHFVAGVGVVVLLVTCLAGVEGRKVEEKKTNELNKQETNAIKTPSLFSLFKRLLPEKTLQNIRAAISTARPQPKAKSLNLDDAKSRSMKSKKKPIKETKTKVAPTVSANTKKLVNRLRTSVNPKTTTIIKTKVTPKTTKITKKTSVKPTFVRKQKTGKELRSRHNSKTSFPAFHDETAPVKEEMQILTHDQKRNRLRQELVRETEGNCLAKILCGTGSKPKPKQQNTLVSDTAYLIKEFFNIFDFTIDDVREEIQEIDDVNKKAYEAEQADKKKKKKEEEEEEEDEEEDDNVDDEEDEIYRKNFSSEAPKKKKYTTRIPGNKDNQKTTTSQQPVVTAAPAEQKLEPVMAQPKTRRPKPVSALEMTTSGDMVPMKKYGSTVSSNSDRLGEVVTPSSMNLLTSTIMSTSMSGSATLQPVDMPFSIPLKTAKDDADDDDEEDDNQKYDDNEEDGTYHRVTLEELVGDIQLNPQDFDMIRRGRSMGRRMPRMKIALKNVTSDKYIQAKLRQMKMVQSEAKKLQIANRIAKSMREPRQCRQFSQVAQEVLQTCPLTTEVIRFFNTNLKNGTSIEVKRIPPGGVKEGGGLVLLNNDESGTHQAYFVDNSPQVANTKIQLDLKNPSLPGSWNTDESQYTVYEKRPNPNPQNSNLNQNGQEATRGPVVITTQAPPPPKKESSKEDSEEEQDDDGSDEDEEDDDEERRLNHVENEEEDVGRRDDEDEEEDYEEENYDVAGSGEEDEEEYDDDGDGDDDYSEDDSSQNNKESESVQKVVIKIKDKNDHNKIQGGLTNQPNAKLVVRPQPPTQPSFTTPTLPPGIIRVYGIPQPSFDQEFTRLTPPIGSQPIQLFGDEFLDSPPYRRRRYGHRTSKKAKTGVEDDEVEDAENIAYNARIPKHPPLEAYSHDGEDDDDDADNKQPYRVPKKKHQESNSGKPLGGVKGDGDDDDDDKNVKSSEKKDDDDDDDDKNVKSSEKDDDDDKKITSSEKKDDDDKDNSVEQPPVKIHTIDAPPFSPSLEYSYPVPQPSQYDFFGGSGSSPQYEYHNQYQQQYQYQNVPVRRPHSLFRPIKIMPDVGYRLRPGRLYPLYNHGK